MSPAVSATISAYTFNPSAGTVTFTGLTVVDANRVLAVYDQTVNPQGLELGTVLYLAEQAEQASVTGNVLTLPTGSIPPDAKSTDTLHIDYELTPPHGSTLAGFTNHGAFPATGVSNVYYWAQDTNQLYIWDGSAFIAV